MKRQGDSAKKHEKALEIKIMLGTITGTKPDAEKIVLLPSKGMTEDREKTVFRLGKSARVILDGQKVEPADVEKGQQAQVEYVVKGKKNRARTVELFSASGGGKETTG